MISFKKSLIIKSLTHLRYNYLTFIDNTLGYLILIASAVLIFIVGSIFKICFEKLESKM